jgi:hypothetical protein
MNTWESTVEVLETVKNLTRKRHQVVFIQRHQEAGSGELEQWPGDKEVTTALHWELIFYIFADFL